MPALFPVDNTLGALFIGTVSSSIVYGVTSLQVWNYYTNHCSRDRLPLKLFVAILMVIDSVNVAFILYTTYRNSVTNFGDYRSNAGRPWSLIAAAFSAMLLEGSVQHFYAYRVYQLSGKFPYLPAMISASSLAAFVVGTVFCVEALEHPREPSSYMKYSISSLACKILCDFLITVGMVYTLLRKRSFVRRTNSTINLLAVYMVNCGTLNLVSTISCLILRVRYPGTLTFVPLFFIMVRLYFCAFMAILNSRDGLRETLNGPDNAIVTFSQFKARHGITGVTSTTVPNRVDDTPEPNINESAQMPFPPVPPAKSFSGSVLDFDREKCAGPHGPESLSESDEIDSQPN